MEEYDKDKEISEKETVNEANFETIQPQIFEKPKEAELRLRDNSKIKVEHLGEDYYGVCRGKKIWCPIYSYGAIKKLCDEIKYATKYNWDQIIVITGREGAGKSDLALHLVQELRPDFDLNQIAWTQKELKQRVFNANFYDLVWMDEAGEALFSQEWNTTGQRDLIKAFLRCRIMKLTTILVLPHIMLLNKKLRERRVWWWLEVYAKDLDERGYVQIRRGPLKQNPFKEDIFWHGVFTLRYPPLKKHAPELWKKYEKIKIKRLGEINKQAEKEPPSKYAYTYRERLKKAVRNLHNAGFDIKQIASLFDVSTDTVRDYVGVKISAKDKTKAGTDE